MKASTNLNLTSQSLSPHFKGFSGTALLSVRGKTISEKQVPRLLKRWAKLLHDAGKAVERFNADIKQVPATRASDSELILKPELTLNPSTAAASTLDGPEL